MITNNKCHNLKIDRPIVLIGLMGVGKSTIGRRLAARLGIDFVDADQEIESAAGQSVAEIFEKYGETYFRDGERRVIVRLIEGRAMVIATGGGAFMNENTRALILEKRSLSGSMLMSACSPSGLAAATRDRCLAGRIQKRC